MTRRRLPVLIVLVAGLLAIVALVAHGRPLAGTPGQGSGLPPSFWDYAFTSVAIVVGFFWLAVLVGTILSSRQPMGKPPSLALRTFRALVSMMAIGLLLLYVGPRLKLKMPRSPETQPGDGGRLHGQHGAGHPGGAANQTIHLRWEEIAIVVGLLLAAVAVAAAARLRRPKGDGLPALAAPKAVAAAVDESLDDLRSDSDVRRAIVAAYARMETALARAGVPRRPAEAPLEYLTRSLLELDLDAAAVSRLTELFEWARFSHHEPEPYMRDEAVDALVAIRDSLLAPVGAAA